MNLEIERKYVIEKPLPERMRECGGYTSSDIVQIYLTSPLGITHRVRSRSFPDGRTLYYETRKIRIDKMSSHELEREIEREEFDVLAEKIAAGSRPIVKTRHTFDYLGQTFEIDVYPEWQNTAIMETELSSREREVQMPEFIKILREVTGIKAYSNAAMSRKFPDEIV